MKLLFATAITLMLSSPVLAKHGHGHHGAPGPSLGTGLPVLLVAGGAYWAVRRLRNKAR